MRRKGVFKLRLSSADLKYLIYILTVLVTYKIFQFEKIFYYYIQWIIR